MKNILCYGDSLTYGYDPSLGGRRHLWENRWPTVLESKLAGGVRCIAEGLNGRTTVLDDWYSGADRNGARVLPTLLRSHSPLDLVIIMLGTNDLKPFLSGSAREASNGMRRLAQIVRSDAAAMNEVSPLVMFVAPPPFSKTNHLEMMAHFGGQSSLSESSHFAHWYKRRAMEEGVAFFDAGSVATGDPEDGVHLGVEATRAIGIGLAPIVARLLQI